jgi:hypothetical protein
MSHSIHGGARANSLDHALAPVIPVLLALLALACVAGFARAVAIVPLHVPLDPNEGWNAYFGAAAMSGHGLYPDPAGFMTNNYPPLSFFIVGALGRLIGDNIVAGRIISLSSFLILCGLVALAVRRMNGSWRAADFAALFLAAVFFIGSDYVGMNDPQLLGHALQLAALLLVLREPRGWGATLMAAALFVAGSFVKHNLVALPVASILWLFLVDRRSAFRLALASIGLAALGLVVFRLESGFHLLARLNSPRTWSLPLLWENLLAWLPLMAVPGLATAALAVWRVRDRFVVLAAIYAVVAFVSGAVLLGGAGVDVNAMFDADIALALGVGVTLGRLAERRSPLPHIAGRALALACVVPLAFLAITNSDWRDSSFWLHPMRDETTLARQDIGFLRARTGPAMCENLGFCYWAGKPAVVDVFNLDQQLRTGARDAGPFLRAIAARRFAVIEFDETTPYPLPADVDAAIYRFYRVDHTDDEGVFLAPR